MAPGFGAREFDQVRRAAADAVVWGLPLILTDLVARAHPLNGRFFELPTVPEGLPPGLLARKSPLSRRMPQKGWPTSMAWRVPSMVS